jgi:hypothetical protein
MVNRCRATSKRSKQPCQRAPMQNGLCYMHGGATPSGMALPQTTTGRYSKHLPTRMGERYQQALADSELLAMREEVAVIDARLADVLGRVDTGESGHVWATLGKAWRAYRTGPPEKRMEAEAQISDLILTGTSDYVEAYRFEPERYISEKLGWEPWHGESPDQPGQADVLDAYALALRQQHRARDFEAGEVSERSDLLAPGQVIQNQIRVEAGHTIGKTKMASGIVNHFFDCFAPSIIYTFAPTRKQIHDLLWKEIKTDRAGKGLPGRILDLALDRGPDHFANGMATNNAGGTGTERVQGQHGKYLMFILDEAEGIADYVWDAIKSMMSGGIAIVLMLANPRTRFSRFHKARELPSVRSFRISCIWHPNVLHGREIVPEPLGATTSSDA